MSYFEFFGVRGVLVGFQDLKPRTTPWKVLGRPNYRHNAVTEFDGKLVSVATRIQITGTDFTSVGLHSVAHLLLRIFFFALSTPPFPRQFLPPNSVFLDLRSTLSSRERQPAEAGFQTQFGTGVAPQEKKENPFFFWRAKKGEVIVSNSTV